jgi:Flp pilus assembly protein TadG
MQDKVMGFIEWLQHGITHVNRAKRTQQPPICAYCWGGGSPVARKVKDISTSGAYLYMPEAEMWYPGTVLTVVLQSDSGNAETPEESESLTVSCRVIRHGPDGIGVAFMFSKPEERKSLDQFLRRTLNGSVSAFVTPCSNNEGQALVEFALMVPLLCLLIVNMINFGAFFFGWITVANAARAGAQYAIMAGASVTAAQPTASAVSAVITNDFASLLNGTSPTVNVCIYSGSTIQPSPYQLGTCSGASSDPESSFYVGAVVDVTYTYTPPIPLFSFPSLGIRATLPPTTIHRRTYMRMLQ